MIKYQGHTQLKTMTNNYECFVKLEMNIEEQLNSFLGIVETPKQKIDESTEIRNQVSNFQSAGSLHDQNNNSNALKLQDSFSRSPKKGRSQKSHHHNLQKHTVTALRDIVKMPRIQELISKGEINQKAGQIWKQFLNIKGKQVMTKKFLATLFSNQLESVSSLRDFGFHKIYSTMSQSEILEGKIQLMKVVGLLLSDKAIEQHIERRQIQRKEQFKLYLLYFRDELESSDLKKRISKLASREIKSKAKRLA